jgi:hypothetical protein
MISGAAGRPLRVNVIDFGMSATCPFCAESRTWCTYPFAPLGPRSSYAGTFPDFKFSVAVPRGKIIGKHSGGANRYRACR